MRTFIESTGGLITVLFTGMLLFGTGAVVVSIAFPKHDVLETFLISGANNFMGALLLLARGSRPSTSVDASGKSVEVNVEQKPQS